MRLIDADALINDLEYDVELNARLLDDTNTVGFHRELYWLDKTCKENAIQFLKDTPSVDAVPVRHGRWEDCSNGWMCSICGRDSTRDTDYCPNCGAKMDAQEEEYEYERASDMRDYCERYEPTYNPEDGSL